MKNKPALAVACAGLVFVGTPIAAEVVFSESFESPVVTGFASNTVPDNGNWIGSSGAFNASVRGLYDDFVAWPGTPAFSTPYGDQGYFLDYSTTMLTTAQGATGQTITAGVAYTLTFNAAFRAGTSADYRGELVAFEAGDDNTARQNPNSTAGTVVASASGAITASDMSDEVMIVFSPDAGNAHLGKELGIRFDDASGSAIYDNVRLIVGHDYAPNPANGEDLSAGGNVTLSWTNLPPVAPANETYVDILFGTDPNALSLEVDGQLTGLAVVNAPEAGTYFWRIDSYPDGDPEGTPVSSNVYSFTIADTDGDGLPDDYEILHSGTNTGLNPGGDLENDGAGDGLINLEEYQYGTDPNDPDSDDDNLEDGPEINGTAGLRPATNPLLADTDADGLDDDVETNTGTWISATDTGTNPTDVDWDKDGLLDGAETNTGILVDRFNTGTDPFDTNSDDDNAGDWYEVAGSLTDPHSSSEESPIPYPLPDPDPVDTGASDKPVKVYILSGQSNMVGYGQVTGSGPGTLDTITKRENKFPNLLDAGGNYLPRQDVYYRGVISAGGNGPLAPGFGKGSTSIGPELGFGQVMGWFHDEPVLIIKASIGNRGLQWDFLPPGSAQFDYTPNGKTYPGYGGSPRSWTTGTTPMPISWYAGKEFDRFFLHKDDWAPAGASSPQDPNVSTVLDNWATEYPDWAAQGFEIAGFGWFHGFDDANGTNGPEAGRYEQNMVQLIKELRTYFDGRFPGKGAANAPFVASTYIQGGPSRTPRALQVADALLNISGDAGNYPEFVGNVKTHESIAYWRDGSESPSGDGIHHHWNAETFMLVGDGMGRAMLTLQNDTTPPFPVTFDIAPTAVDPTTVGMVVTPATDPSGPVEYFFANVTASSDSGWITDTRWDETGLAPGSYDYRFKARDAEGNESDWSATLSASPGTDNTAPSPSPMSFASPPAATGENSITMTATAASDINGVEYEFVCTVGGGPGSGWQESPVFSPSGLTADTPYTYLVRARDTIGNTTADSSAESATTDAPDTTAPTPNPMTFDTPPTATGENSITMTATTATDPSGVKYRFNNVTLSTDSGWLNSPTYEQEGLSPDTEYTYTVQARDNSPAQTATAASEPASATTDAPDTAPPAIETYSPAQDATYVPLDSNLVVTFDEDVVLGSSGLITIKKISDGSTTTIDVTDDSRVSVSDDVMTINPSTNLELETTYAVLIADTAVDDLVGNSFPGLTDDTVWRFTTIPPPPVGLAFSDDFESPDVTAAESGSGGTGGTSNKVDTSKWVRAGQGHGSNANGIEDEGAGDFTDPVGEQAYAFRYTNSGVTTKAGAIGALSPGQTITVSFDVVLDGYNDGGPWRAKLVVFNEGADRDDVRSDTGSVVLKEENGTASSTTYQRITFDYEVDGVEDAPHFGKDIALRFKGATTSANIDNVSVTSVGIGAGPVDHFAISAIPSPQTVGTPITGITITAQDVDDNTATDFTGTVTFDGTGGFSGTSANFVDGVLSGVSATPTVAGSDLTFTVDDGSGHTGSTVIALIDPAETAYETWSGGLDFETDPNGDGIANGLAFGLGAADPQAAARGLLPAAEVEPGFLTLQFQRAGNLGDAQLYVEHGNDLGGWTQLLIPAASTTDPHLAGGVQVLVTPGSPNDAVTVKIPDTLESASGALFARLRVTED